MSLTGFLDATPIILLIGIGVLLRLTRLVDERNGLALTRVAYYVTIPAAIFSSIAKAQFTRSMLYLPLLGLALPTLLAGIAYLTTRRLKNQPAVRGVMLSAMVVLGVFGYPFMELFFGAEGLTRIALYDVGNSVFAGTLALWFAQRFGVRSADSPKGQAWKRVATSPVMWAAALGAAASLLHVPVSGPVGNLLGRLAAANTPLAMTAVGVFVRPRAAYGALIAQFVGLRMVLGGVLAWLAAMALGMDGLDVVVACTAASLPAGTTALIYAGNEGLDAEFAASLISVTVIVGAVAINILPHLLARFYLP